MSHKKQETYMKVFQSHLGATGVPSHNSTT